MHPRDIPDSADAKPSVVPSETPHGASLENKPAPGATPATDKESSEGPPKTVWGTIAFASTIISGAYCWVFTAWDKSEFPEETLQNPWFWLGFGLLLALATVYALFVRTSHLLDRVLIGALCLAATGSAIQSYRVSREIRPSETQFTIAVFGFIGDGDALTNDMARRIRGTILDQLRTRVGNVPHQPLILSRDRNPKGETPEEEADSIRKWAKRGRGAHLALWLQVHMKSGNQYTAIVRYIRVSPWGTELHKAGLLVIGESKEEIPFTAPAGGSMPADQARKILEAAEFFWGLAAFQRDDFQTALSVLPPLNTGVSEFYSGETLLEESRTSSSPARLRQQALDDIARAIQIESSEGRKGFYLGELSDELVSYVDSGMSDAPRVHLRYASDALCQQQASFHRLGRTLPAAQSEISEAEIFLQLADVEHESDWSRDLQKARFLASAAAKELDLDDKSGRSTTENILGSVDFKEGDLEEAVRHYQQSIDLEDDPVVRKSLAQTEMRLALDSSDNSMLTDATRDYKQAAKVCEQKDRHLCFIVHYGSCSAGLTVAERLKFDLASRTKWLEYADTECEAARQYESMEQPAEVLELSFQLVRVAEEFPKRRHVPHEFYEESIEDLTKVIDALNTNNSVAARDLLLQRAQLYHLSGPAYQQLAQQDQAEAQRLSQQRTKLAASSDQYRPKWAASLACTESPASRPSPPKRKSAR
jgi:tetratricopeptide (TPR) repeat protein